MCSLASTTACSHARHNRRRHRRVVLQLVPATELAVGKSPEMLHSCHTLNFAHKPKLRRCTARGTFFAPQAGSHRAYPTPSRGNNCSSDADDQHRPATRASQRPFSQQPPRHRSRFSRSRFSRSRVSPRYRRLRVLLTIALDTAVLQVIDGSIILRVAQGLRPPLPLHTKRRGGGG